MKTTRELAREDSQKQVVANLQELLVKNYDANKGFKKAVKETEEKELKEFFKVQAFLHQRYATELDKHIRGLNNNPIEQGSTVGKFHRIWMDIILSISGDDDKAILEECRRGQTATMKAYQEKLRNYKFPKKITEILKKHLVELELTREEVKTVRDLK